MISQTTFEMLVADVFRLSDGRTVFAGKVLSGPKRINRGRCTLLVNGEERATFQVEGEMQFTPNSSDSRAVSTLGEVLLSSDEVKAHPDIAVILRGESVTE